MIIEIATAALLSCAHGQQLINNIDSTQYTRSQYRELVETIAEASPRRCNLVATPTLYRNQVRQLMREHQHQHQHDPVRVVIRPTFYF